MIEREIKKLKYTRDYLFNSKKKEKDYFRNYSEKCEGFSWIDYRKNTMIHFDDRLNVIFSWKLLFQKVSYILGVLGLIQLFLNTFIGGAIVALSVLVHIAFLILKKKQSQELGYYGFALAMIHSEIERNYDLKLSINPQK